MVLIRLNYSTKLRNSENQDIKNHKHLVDMVKVG